MGGQALLLQVQPSRARPSSHLALQLVLVRRGRQARPMGDRVQTGWNGRADDRNGRRDRRALLGGQPVMLDSGFYPASFVEGTPLAGEGSISGGVYAALIDAGLLDPATATTTDTIRSRAATAQEADRLKVRPGSPVLDIERITRDGEGRPVELLRRVANGARVRVVHDARTITV